MSKQKIYSLRSILMVTALLFVAVFIRAEARSSYEAFNAHCVDVIGADTIEVWTEDEKKQQVRLIGVDVTEAEEHFPRYVHTVISEWVDGKMARVEVYERPSEGEILGRVIIDHYDLSYMMISEGLARYDGKAPAVLRLYLAEESAQQAGRGMWSDEEDVRRKSSDDPQRSALSDVAWKLDLRRTLESNHAPVEHSDEAITMQIGNWVGEHRSLLIANWGEPDRIGDDGSGGEVLSYDRCQESLIYSGDEACELSFFVDAAGVIYDRQWH